MRFAMPAPELRRFISIPANIVPVATFRADADGITMDAVDDARVMMTVVRIPASSMTEYDGPQNFTADISVMLKVLALADVDDTVTVSLEQDGRLAIRFGTITRLMGTVPTEQAAMRIPDIPYTAHIGMPAQMLREAVRATSDIGDAVTIASGNGKVHMESSRDMDSARYDVIPTDMDGEQKASYPQAYFAKVPKMVPGECSVQIDLGTDMPVRMRFDDGAMSGMVLIAPTVTGEGERSYVV